MPDGSVIIEDTDLQISVISAVYSVRDWDLVRGYMILRKEVFIEKMSWELTQVSGVEFEQYDTPDTIYIVAHRGRQVVGGARLRKADGNIGNGKVVYSYMIRDAVRGLLPSLPVNLCYAEPTTDPSVWELTRLVSNDQRDVNQTVLEAANDFLHSMGASRCLFLGPPAFMRMARKLGWEPEALGPIVGNADGRFLAFQCPVRPPGQPNAKHGADCKNMT